MSFKIIGKAFDIALKANDKLVFLSLCEYANDEDSTCYPSLKTLMTKATISKGALSYSLNVLENLGFISRQHRTRENGSATSTKYTVYIDTVLDTERYKNRQSLIKIDCSNNELGGTVHKVNNPSSDNEQPKRGQSSDNEHLEPLAKPFNPNSNPRQKNKNTKVSFNTLLEDIQKEVTRKSKVSFTQKGLEAYLLIDDKSQIKDNYIKHQKIKDQFAQTIANFLVDYVANIAELSLANRTQGYKSTQQIHDEHNALKQADYEVEAV